MINVLICEDDSHSAAINHKYIDKIEESCKFGLKVTGVVSGYHQAMKFLAAKEVDILLLDIGLEAPDEGVKISQQVMKLYPSVRIIFITGHSCYATAVFRYGYDYLLKPVGYERLKASVTDLCHQILKERTEKENYLHIISNYTCVRVPVDEIFHICKEGRKVLINLVKGEVIPTYNKLEDIISKLGGRFIQVSKTQYVCWRKIKSYEISTGKITFLHPGPAVFASKSYRESIKRFLILKEGGAV